MGQTESVFFTLLKAGLWEQEVNLAPYGTIDFDAVYKLAEEQSVIGLIAAGLEHISDMKVSRNDVLPFLTQVIVLEQRNAEMNRYIGKLVANLRKKGIQALLVKGQGVAQCYTRPLWRASGDIDLLFDANGYEQAKSFLCPLASIIDMEGVEEKHQGITIDGFAVELHGTLNFGLSRRVDKLMAQVQYQVCNFGAARAWYINETHTDVLLPAPDADILIIFTHFLRHFYKGGIGLRQICDWCRLLWTYRETINIRLLKEKLTAAGLESEWKAFAAYAVDYLGMLEEAMPLYENKSKWHRKANKLNMFILKSGNFGHNIKFYGLCQF